MEMPKDEIKTDRIPWYYYLYPLAGGAGLGFFIQYRKFERGIDSLFGIRLLILAVLGSLLMIWIWRTGSVAVSYLFRTSLEKVSKRLCYGYGCLFLLFFYPLLTRYVLRDWRTSFRLMALTVFLIAAILEGIALLLVVRKADGNRASRFGWYHVPILLGIVFLYYAHQLLYLKTHRDTWSNLSVADEVRRAIVALPNTAHRFDEITPQRPHGDLIISVVPINPVGFMQPECRIDLKLIGRNGRVFEKHSLVTPLRREWTESRLALSVTAQDDIAVEVRCVPFPKKPVRRWVNTLVACSDLPWREPKGFLIALTRPRICAPRDTAFPNVILISIDTVRADYVGAYGSGTATPAIDSLAEDGILFKHAIAPTTWTLSSHMSMMTSLYASYHGINHTDLEIPDLPLTTIAEVFQDSGYATAAFTGKGYLASRYGFSKGFDSYHEKSAHANEATDIFGRGEQWVRHNKEQRFFLFLHTYEAHNYLYKQTQHMLYADKDYDGVWDSVAPEDVLPTLGTGTNEPDIGAEDIRFLKDLYRGAVGRTDEELGEFLAALRAEGVYDDTLIILTSDHGEGFGETHAPGLAVWHHNREPYREEVHVPLIIKLPARGEDAIERKSYEDSVSIIDIPPTILAVCGLPVPEQFQGVPLIPLPSSEDGAPQGAAERRIFTEVIYSEPFVIPSSVAIYSKDTAYIHYLDAGRQDELYDMQKDSQQRENLSDSREGEPMLEAITEHLEEGSSYSKPRYKRKPPDEEFANQLRALGYLK